MSKIVFDLETLKERVIPSDEFKVTHEFLEKMLAGQAKDIAKYESFSGFFRDFVNELLGREPEGVEGVLLFNGIRFDLDQKNETATFVLMYDGEDIATIGCMVEMKSLGTITLSLTKGIMQLNIK